MLLAVAATEIEMAPFRTVCGFSEKEIKTVTCGVGPINAAVSVTRALASCSGAVSAVVNFGIGGAYHLNTNSVQPQMLDICLAERECFGDFGVCFESYVEPFENPAIGGVSEYQLDGKLVDFARKILVEADITCLTGTFVTVSGASGTKRRGDVLAAKVAGICENMEGAAVARSCMEFSVPLLEIRAISNIVEDRPGSGWKLEEACFKSAQAASKVVAGLRSCLDGPVDHRFFTVSE